ncbi:hypothetical protein [Streptomyces massasporeus]|uniref:hypothetical protein n=1 Tax=Streptomyces massasporeus TaxID=67324 RepID=UPI003716C7AE
MLKARPVLPKIEDGRVQGLQQLIEDGIHLVVEALLVLLAGFPTTGVVHDVIRSIQRPYREETVVLSALTNSLIGGIRKVLTVTAEAEKSLRWESRRRPTPPGDCFPPQETPRSPSPEPSPGPVRG